MEDLTVDCEDIYRVDLTYPFMAGIDPLRLPSSIIIPPKYLENMASMERQYWEIKAKYFDVLILFKKGKFYELYDHDAVIAHREFGLKLVFDASNRGKMRLAGIPEQSFSEWARLFVFRGYKVGRVEQMKEDENSTINFSTKSKIVQRELVEVITPGTLTDPTMLSGYGTVFTLALFPLENNIIDGFAVDLSRRVVYHCPCGVNGVNIIREEEVFLMISALLQQLRPKEIIFPRNLILNNDSLNKNEDLTFSKRLVEWMEGEGFRVELVDASDISINIKKDNFEIKNLSIANQFLSKYFKILKLNRVESILSEAEPYTFHLPQQQEEVKKSILINKALNEKELNNNSSSSSSSSSLLLWHERREDNGLTLDATTVSNLELVNNLRDGSEKGTLNQILNRCCTNGGKRLFRSWILRPSASSRVIAARQETIRFIIDQKLNEMWSIENEQETNLSNTSLINLSSVTVNTEENSPCGIKRERLINNSFESRFGSLVGVDFERNLSRLADLKNDNAQVAFVDPLLQYKKHLQLIIATVQAFEEMVEWSKSIQKISSKPLPLLLKELLNNIDSAEPAVSTIEKLFDRHSALESGMIIPSRGTSLLYDEASDRLDNIQFQLNSELKRMQNEIFNGAILNYSDIGRDRFLVEVPIKAAPKLTPSGFTERSRTAKSVRYAVSNLEPLAEAHKKATAEKSHALLLVLKSIASHICNFFPILYNAMSALSYFDCLLSLASLQNSGITTSWPIIKENKNESSVIAEQITHPFLNRDSVPNSINLNKEYGRILVLTGPNMAGKSTLMRTISVNIIIAQMGGPIFGKSMYLEPLSRIFTRIGARDASHKGQSTLFVELSETSDILRYSDSKSLCLIDELGRGTSTHDGYAIAYATLNSLKKRQPSSPLVLFSTHYHALAQEQIEQSETTNIKSSLSVQLGYMDFALSNSKNNEIPSITFLYRLVPGICTRSYGVEVALLAGIPSTLVNMANKKSLELAKWYNQQKDLNTIRKFIS